MGAGALPVDEHRRRPPIPIVPVDARTREAALARGASAAEAWLAAVNRDASAAPRVRVADSGEAEVLLTALAARRDTPGMSVGEVALAVDAGRAVAGAAAGDGISVLVARAPAARDDGASRAVADNLTGATEPVANGPLGALRRLGDATTAYLCGVALGAGEHGLGCVCDGLAALAGAAVAIGIEPDLRPRLIAVRGTDGEAPALRAHLGFATIDLADVPR